MKKGRWKWVIWGTIGLLALILGGYKGVEATSTDQFCSSCHVMKKNFEASFHTVHRAPAVNCKDCHLPHDNVIKMLGYKAYSGMKDVVSNTIGPPEKIGATPYGRTVIQANCIRCHSIVVEKLNMSGERLCFDCHRGIPHGNSGL